MLRNVLIGLYAHIVVCTQLMMTSPENGVEGHLGNVYIYMFIVDFGRKLKRQIFAYCFQLHQKQNKTKQTNKNYQMKKKRHISLYI